MPAAPLTPRETEILRLIAAGQTSKEISRTLSLSIRTVGRHITNIYEKIGARSRADATAYAVRHRIATE
jgi:DNA-binding CsgD family transcriptional regulator